MAFKIISREELGIEDVEAPLTRQDPDDLLGITIHHFGSPRAGDTPAENRKLWLGVDNFHEQGEYNDIAYSFGFDDFGQILEGRGWGFRTGANGTSAANATFLAFVYLGNSDVDAFNEKAQDACGWLIGQAFKKGVGKRIVPHSNWVQTGCPGNKAARWISTGGWKKDLPDAEPKEVQYLLMDDGDILDRSARSPIGQSKHRLDSFRSQQEFLDKSHARMAQEGANGNVTIWRKVI